MTNSISKTIVLLVAVMFSLALVAQNRSVNLLKNEPFEKVQKMAKEQNKLLFLDFGSPRCSPCLYMKNNIFTIDSVADFVNERFVSVDYTEGPEKKRLSEIYGVYTEPVFLLMDADGVLMHRTEGRSTAGEMLERFRQGLDKNNNLVALQRRYKEGERDVDFLLKFINTLHIAGLREQKKEVLANIFHDAFELEQLYTEDYWNLFRKYDDSPVSRQTLFVMDNMDKFAEKFGESAVLSKIETLYGGSSRGYIFGRKAPGEDPDYAVILRYAQNSNHPNASKWLAYLVPAGHKFGDWVRMAKEIENALSFNILKRNEREMYKKMMSEQLAWYCNDPNALQYSVKWIDAMLEYTTDPATRESIIGTKESVLQKIAGLSKPK